MQIRRHRSQTIDFQQEKLAILDRKIADLAEAYAQILRAFDVGDEFELEGLRQVTTSSGLAREIDGALRTLAEIGAEAERLRDDRYDLMQRLGIDGNY